jgi:hypothetical protein
MTQVAPPPPTRRNAARRPGPRRGRRRLPIGRRSLFAVTAALAAVVVVVAVLAALGRNGSGGGAAEGQPGVSLLQRVTGVDGTVIERVGTAGLPNRFYRLDNAAPLTVDGKPELLYVGADYCPYCAAQRWSMVVALSRFGSFRDLGLTSSGDGDAYPNTATFSFSGVQYSSPYLSFVAVETADRFGNPKDTPSDAQKQLVASYDVPPYVPANAAGGIPWIDVGNRYAMISSGYTPQVLAGLDWNRIAERLTDPGDPVTRGIVGNANNITAAICRATGMQPAAVCAAAPIAQIAAQMP